MSEQSLNGRTAIVTGASSGIGRAIALRLASAGADVYLVGRSEDALQEAKQAIEVQGGKAALALLDVRDAHAMGSLVQRAIAETGTLNIMVNNAGLSYPGSIVDGQPAHWREMYETNVIALLVGAQAAIRAMRHGGFAGHVVNISSIAGRMEGSGVYGSTKAAVNLLGQTLRQEVANDPIRIVQILPGAVATNFARNFPPEVMQNLLKTLGLDIPFQPGTIFSEEQIAYLQQQAAPFLASGDDIARAVLFAVTQPAELNVFEMVVRPARDIPF